MRQPPESNVQGTASRRKVPCLLALIAAFLIGDGRCVPPQPAAAQSTQAETGSFQEYAIKVAMLYHFVEFVQWPPQAERDTITVYVAGKTAFEAARETINGKSVRGKTLVVRQYAGPEDLRHCQMLFISASEGGRFKQILQAARNSSILTVGEMDGFLQNGGIINFWMMRDPSTHGQYARFEVNAEAAERAGLTIRSQLLRLAKIVRS